MKAIKINCSTCNKEMSKYDRDLKRNNKNYCSRECYDGRRSENLKRLKRHTKYYNDLLDSSVCKCGISEKYLLQIHHMDGNKNNNSPNNLEIVCANCHVKRHLKKNKKGELVYHPRSLTK